MQLVRNLYTQDVTRAGIEGYKRKIREARLAQELEEEHSKEWVLGRYLNTVPYGTYGGQTAIGAGAAARLYFDKRVQDLTLREAAMLAGMPQAPSQYSPVDNPEGTKARRNEVLQKMAELGYISQAKAEAEMEKGLGLNMDRYFSRARERYVLDYVKSELIKEYGLDATRRGGFTVTTTINLKYQQYARDAIANNLAGVGPSSAIVTIDPKNGDILTMASTQTYGRSKGKSTFNLAAQGHRQPGSAFKTMALLTALREGVNPNSTTYTSKSPMKITKPPCGSPAVAVGAQDLQRQGRRLDGPALRDARLRQLRLRPARLRPRPGQGQGDGADDGHQVQADRRLRRVAGRPHGRRLAARDGQRLRHDRQRRLPHPPARDQEDRDATARPVKLPKRWRVKRTKAFEDGVTDQAVQILAANVAGGTGGKAQIPGCAQGGKTGTTDKNIDAWFVGFTPRVRHRRCGSASRARRRSR